MLLCATEVRKTNSKESGHDFWPGVYTHNNYKTLHENSAHKTPVWQTLMGCSDFHAKSEKNTETRTCVCLPVHARGVCACVCVCGYKRHHTIIGLIGELYKVCSSNSTYIIPIAMGWCFWRLSEPDIFYRNVLGKYSGDKAANFHYPCMKSVCHTVCQPTPHHIILLT